MSIIFHCEHCNKKIEAADGAGGKWGKCPSCHNKVYVPDMNPSDAEELTLAPLDESEDARQKALMAETYRISQDILQQREDAEKKGRSSGPVSPAGPKDLKKDIVQYLRLMADGDLQKASAYQSRISACGSLAIDIIDEIALSDMPEPRLSDIPAQVLSGLIRTLRAKVR